MTKQNVVFVTPAGDTQAGILSQWGRLIAAGMLRDDPIHLDGHVSRGQLETWLSSRLAAVVFFCHGQPDSLGNAVSLLDLENAGMCRGWLVIAIACHSALRLGPAAIEEGARSYLGFKHEFSWPLQYSRPFGDAVMAGLRPILEGAPIEAGERRMKEEFLNLYDRFKNGSARRQNNSTLFWMSALLNAETLCLLGDPQASILDIEEPLFAGG
jgi:hypothetical protein